jgi:hypothetical protein
MEPDRDSGGQATPVVNSSEKSVVVVHSTMKLPKACGAASHMGLDKAFDKRLQVTEELKAKTVHSVFAFSSSVQGETWNRN